MNLRKFKVSEASGVVLDWMVAKCEYGATKNIPTGFPAFSEDWSQGGPIIEREKMTVGTCVGDTQWAADIYQGAGLDIKASRVGPTPLIAAMRCYVASKLGEEVEVPEELL
jgi:hypothetical protein